MFTSKNLCWQQLVPWTWWHGTREGWAVSSKPLHASKNSLFTPKSPNPGRATGRMKGCRDLHAETSRLPLSIPCHQHCSAGMCSGISGISSIHSGTAKGKKTFIINKLSSLTGYFANSWMVIWFLKRKATIQHSFPSFFAASQPYLPVTKQQIMAYFFHLPSNGTFSETQENFQD